jgi:hypothetical protein
MNDTEINLAIAKIKGICIDHEEAQWQEGPTSDGSGYDGWFCPKCGCDQISYSKYPCCPNWSYNMNEVYKLEEEIPENDWGKYEIALGEILDFGHGELGYLSGGHYSLIHASARDRCLAWLKYKEGTK